MNINNIIIDLENDIFPHLESTFIEFKENLTQIKISNTVCAFLNSNKNIESFIIFGIKDNRQILGIKNLNNIDSFLLNIDTFFNSDKIVTVDTHQRITMENLGIKQVTLKNGNIIIILIIKNGNNYEYQLSNGSIYYRANASNYEIKATKLYSETELINERNVLSKKYLIDIKNLTDNINFKNIEIYKLKSEIEDLKLENEILINIKKTENKIPKEESWFNFFTNI